MEEDIPLAGVVCLERLEEPTEPPTAEQEEQIKTCSGLQLTNIFIINKSFGL